MSDKETKEQKQARKQLKKAEKAKAKEQKHLEKYKKKGGLPTVQQNSIHTPTTPFAIANDHSSAAASTTELATASSGNNSPAQATDDGGAAAFGSAASDNTSQAAVDESRNENEVSIGETIESDRIKLWYKEYIEPEKVTIINKEIISKTIQIPESESFLGGSALIEFINITKLIEVKEGEKKRELLIDLILPSQILELKLKSKRCDSE
jgi:hypothetical protein